MSASYKKYMIIGICVALACIIATTFLVARPFILNYGLPQKGEAIIVEIPKGYGARLIAEQLQKQGIIDSPLLFIMAGKISSLAGSLKAGEYYLHPGMKNHEILKKLSLGQVVRHNVVIPEGFTMNQIISRLAKKKLINEQKANELIFDPEFISAFGIKAKSLEGFLFPDTYSFPKKIGTKKILSTMVNRFLDEWDELKAIPTKSKLTRLETVTLASIIEKEARVPQERPLIAAVYLNRLKKGMRLQADPTVIYGIPGFKGALKKRHLSYPSAYNTYLNKGLPPGPICSPGAASLAASLVPAKSKAIYFVAKGNGSHHFSTNYREHTNAVRRLKKVMRNRH